MASQHRGLGDGIHTLSSARKKLSGNRATYVGTLFWPSEFEICLGKERP